MKRPAFQFYPADWRKDAELQSCSIAAQGLWINSLCIAHECDPYGHLTVNGKPMTPAQLGRLCGLSAKECTELLAELLDAGVASKTAEGAIFSRRMVRDEEVRAARAAGGESGAAHGAKGAQHGAKGGRPPQARGVSNPPSEGETAVGRGDKKPPSYPPPSSSSSSSASAGVLQTSPPDGEQSASTARTRTLPPDVPKGVMAQIRNRYPPGTYREADWLLAERAVRARLGEGILVESLVAAAEAYGQQQAAIGKAGTQYVLKPSSFFGSDDWRGPFQLPAKPETAMERITRLNSPSTRVIDHEPDDDGDRRALG